jgi:hypothetical protein
MIENEMGYRGSKSDLFSKSVKEQRVDGNRYLNLNNSKNRYIRYTLMGFERNYQVKILSNQINNRKYYSTNSDYKSHENMHLLNS